MTTGYFKIAGGHLNLQKGGGGVSGYTSGNFVNVMTVPAVPVTTRGYLLSGQCSDWRVPQVLLSGQCSDRSVPQEVTPVEKPAALDCRKASNGGSAPTSPVITANGSSRPSPPTASAACRTTSNDYGGRCRC